MTTTNENLNEELETALKKIGFFELSEEQQKQFIEHTLQKITTECGEENAIT
jgi:hypothetical protein